MLSGFNTDPIACNFKSELEKTWITSFDAQKAETGGVIHSNRDGCRYLRQNEISILLEKLPARTIYI
jgi:hypothetical protein